MAVLAEQAGIEVTLADGEARLPALIRPEGSFVSLKALAAVLDLVLTEEGTGKIALLDEQDDKRLEFSEALPSMVRIRGRILSLGEDALRFDGDLYVPASAVPRIASAIREPAPAAPSIDASEKSASALPALRVSLAGLASGDLGLTFLLPEGSEDFTVSKQGPLRVAVRGVGALALPWSDRRLGSEVVESLALLVQEDGFDLLISPGSKLGGVTADALRQPPRVELRFAAGGKSSEGKPEHPRVTLRPGTAADESAAPRAARSALVRRVVIDPGHGGIEDGAIGPAGAKEKDVVLAIARHLAARLRASGLEVILTRNGDVELSLDDRAALANQHRADLFISLHANASRFSRARGAETYILSRDATDDEARTVAALENQASGASPGGDDGEDLPLILWDLAQTQYLNESYALAEEIQTALEAELDIPDRGVRQAPFRVLVGSTCPSVLIEVGFMTNPLEEKLLVSRAYQRRIASVLSSAIVRYRDKVEQAGDPPAAIAP